MNNKTHLRGRQSELDSILYDLKHIKKIGNIISIEIDLEPTILLSNHVLKLCSQHDGLYHLYSSIFINFELMDEITLKHLLTSLIEETGSIINNMIIQVHTKLKSGEVLYNLGLNTDTDMPMLLSLSDNMNYFYFLQTLKFLWISAK